MIKLTQVIIGIEITNAYRPEKSIPNNRDSSSTLMSNQYAIPKINTLVAKVASATNHLLFLFFIATTVKVVDTMKEKTIRMKFNPFPLNYTCNNLFEYLVEYRNLAPKFLDLFNTYTTTYWN